MKLPFFKPLLPIFALTSNLAWSGSPHENIVYDFELKNDTSCFELVLDHPNKIEGRPHLQATPQGLIATPGHDHFTAWKFANLSNSDWSLNIEFRIPENSQYSNSGVYLLFADPQQNLDQLSPSDRAHFEAALAKSRERKAELGEGPFELDYFGYEIQIVSNERPEVPANKRTGAFYGIESGFTPGRQQILNSIDPLPGHSYQLRIQRRGQALETYIREEGSLEPWIPLARLETPSRADDAVRGGAPIALLLQAYANDGAVRKSPEFKSIKSTLND